MAYRAAAAGRFIPACAGNGAARHARTCRTSVHPRVCGERSATGSRTGIATGSSPRVRGTGSPSPGRAPRSPVHPRVCGERHRRIGTTFSTCGSSPRVRGTDLQFRALRPGGRFIPACAGNGGGAPAPFPRSSVHPRVCGERDMGGDKNQRVAGSSPRVRGTADGPSRLLPVRRFIPACAGNGRSGRGGSIRGFIPACAGNGSQTRARLPRPTVHPRVCGERPVPSLSFHSYHGSSPRVRGTGGRLRRRSRQGRFIPACAGNGPCLRFRSIRTTVHPRVCGERAGRPRQEGAGEGSSPRVRGTASHHEPDDKIYRFIPACAGNSGPAPSGSRAGPVHPRVCGEQSGENQRRLVERGSSPRVRGTGSPSRTPLADRRFIPACAGNSLARAGRRRAPAVHPRVCGEQGCIPQASMGRYGSSPRVRGTGGLHLPQQREHRFIPACAGNRPSSARSSAPSSVHPRVCGEQVPGSRRSRRSGGSSPRVRGTASVDPDLVAPSRFIPACAGNSC